MEGIEVMVQQTKSADARDFETLRDSVITLYTNFMTKEHSALADIQAVIQTQMQGVPVSKANDTFYDQLLTIETYMLGIDN